MFFSWAPLLIDNARRPVVITFLPLLSRNQDAEVNGDADT